MGFLEPFQVRDILAERRFLVIDKLIEVGFREFLQFAEDLVILTKHCVESL